MCIVRCFGRVIFSLFCLGFVVWLGSGGGDLGLVICLVVVLHGGESVL